MIKQNYQLLMEKTITDLSGSFSPAEPPTLLLHSCCAPCSSSVIKRLAVHFKLTVFYYNPNIDTQEEYNTRADEQQRLIDQYNRDGRALYPIDYIIKEYRHDQFLEIAEGYTSCPEGGERCFRCYRQRLTATAAEAQRLGFHFFCSTLSLSPLKSAAKINEIGMELSTEQSRWLPSDFKKKNGYLESIQLSKELGLYRQDYCGCEFSRRQSQQAPCTESGTTVPHDIPFADAAPSLPS